MKHELGLDWDSFPVQFGSEFRIVGKPNVSRVNAVSLEVFLGRWKGLCLSVLGKQGGSFQYLSRSGAPSYSPLAINLVVAAKVETWLILPVAYACLKD